MPEHESLAGRLRQFIEAVSQVGSEMHIVAETALFWRHRSGKLRQQAGHAALAAFEFKKLVAGDRPGPGHEFAVAVKGLDATVQRQQGFLQQVFGHTAVAANSIKIGEQRAAQLLEQHCGGFQVAGRKIFHKLSADFYHIAESNMPEKAQKIDTIFPDAKKFTGPFENLHLFNKQFPPPPRQTRSNQGCCRLSCLL